jgi:hypothetical protein
MALQHGFQYIQTVNPHRKQQASEKQGKTQHPGKPST